MSQVLRQRATTATVKMNPEADGLILRSTAGLSASSMMSASPIQHGKVFKLHIPVFYSICPTFIKRLLSSWVFCSFFAPQWKERYLILIGKFFYKFKDVHSATPKGSPFPVDSTEAQIIHQSIIRDKQKMKYEFGNLPAGCTAVFTVSTLQKKHYYAVASPEEASTWVNSLAETRQQTITRSMGHASHMPYPKTWDYFDSQGINLLKTKARIKKRMEAAERRDMEMIDFGSGGPMPRGYHG